MLLLLLMVGYLFSLLADSTGTHSLYTAYKDYEIMFHVTTMLPYTPNNKQQVKQRSVLCSIRPILKCMILRQGLLYQFFNAVLKVPVCPVIIVCVIVICASDISVITRWGAAHAVNYRVQISFEYRKEKFWLWSLCVNNDCYCNAETERYNTVLQSLRVKYNM